MLNRAEQNRFELSRAMQLFSQRSLVMHVTYKCIFVVHSTVEASAVAVSAAVVAAAATTVRCRYRSFFCCCSWLSQQRSMRDFNRALDVNERPSNSKHLIYLIINNASLFFVHSFVCRHIALPSECG